MPKSLPAPQTALANFEDEDNFEDDEDFESSASTGSGWHWIWLVLGLTAAIGFFALGVFSSSREPKLNSAQAAVGDGSTPTTKTLMVHVAGLVNKPGVYEFAFDARVRDAVQKAGGPAKNADLDSINLAAYLEDGQKIEVLAKPSTPSSNIATAPESEETAAPQAEYSQPEPGAKSLAALPDFAAPETEKPSPAKREKRTAEAPQKPKVLPNVPRANTKSGGESQKADPAYLAKHPLNLNSASAEQLELLPGVGPAMAAKIIAARKEKGGFKSVEELDDIPGIGEKKMEKLRPVVTVS